MFLSWLLFGVVVVVPAVWVVLVMIGYLRSAELRAAVRAVETAPDDEPQ
jgi:hypothetical protein